MSGEDEVRRGLEAALLGLQTMAQLMDRLGDLLVDWDARALAPTSAAKTWRVAVDELRNAVVPARDAITTATRLAPVARESSLTMADVRRGYDA